MTRDDATAVSVQREVPGSPAFRRSLLALLLIVPAPSIAALFAGVIAPGPVGQTVHAVLKLWIVVAPLIWWKWVERRPIRFSPARRGGWGLAIGMGLVMGGAMLLAWQLGLRHWVDAEWLRAQVQRVGIGDPAVFLALAFYWVVINSLIEEYVWRWFVWRQFAVLAGERWAILLAALAFTLHHIVALAVWVDWRMNLVGSLGVFAAGLAWGWLYVRTRSVWPCWVSHIVPDLVIFSIAWVLLFG